MLLCIGYHLCSLFSKLLTVLPPLFQPSHYSFQPRFSFTWQNSERMTGQGSGIHEELSLLTWSQPQEMEVSIKDHPTGRFLSQPHLSDQISWPLHYAPFLVLRRLKIPYHDHYPNHWVRI